MALNTGLLVGMMGAAFIFTLTIGYFVTSACIIYGLTAFDVVGNSMMLRISLWAVLLIVTFINQLVWHVVLQTSTCDGIKNGENIAKGAGVGTLPAAVMIAIPMLLPFTSKIVSNLFVEDGKQVDFFNLDDRAKNIGHTEEINDLLSMPFGIGFWGAFAGAYGVAIGSLFSGTCR
jgi:hypothetical protein